MSQQIHVNKALADKLTLKAATPKYPGQAQGEYVIFRCVQQKIDTGGLYLPDDSSLAKEGERFEVISVGDKVTNVKVGDFIRFDPRAMGGFEFEKIAHGVLSVKAIWAIETQ